MDYLSLRITLFGHQIQMSLINTSIHWLVKHTCLMWLSTHKRIWNFFVPWMFQIAHSLDFVYYPAIAFSFGIMLVELVHNAWAGWWFHGVSLIVNLLDTFSGFSWVFLNLSLWWPARKLGYVVILSCLRIVLPRLRMGLLDVLRTIYECFCLHKVSVSNHKVILFYFRRGCAVVLMKVFLSCWVIMTNTNNCKLLTELGMCFQLLLIRYGSLGLLNFALFILFFWFINVILFLGIFL